MSNETPVLPCTCNDPDGPCLAHPPVTTPEKPIDAFSPVIMHPVEKSALDTLREIASRPRDASAKELGEAVLQKLGVTKDTNPKDAVGVKKVPYSTIPAPVVAEVGLAMLEGARKYGRHNYREAGVRASVYFDALKRHMDAWWEGQDVDPDSGMNHIVKAISTLVVLRDSMFNENWEDDRPPPCKNPNWMSSLNEKAAEIIEKYPDPKPALTAKSTRKP